MFWRFREWCVWLAQSPRERERSNHWEAADIPSWAFQFAHFIPSKRSDGWGCSNGPELDVAPPRRGAYTPLGAFLIGHWAVGNRLTRTRPKGMEDCASAFFSASFASKKKTEQRRSKGTWAVGKSIKPEAVKLFQEAICYSRWWCDLAWSEKVNMSDTSSIFLWFRVISRAFKWLEFRRSHAGKVCLWKRGQGSREHTEHTEWI